MSACLEKHSTSVFKRSGLLILFLKKFYNKIYMYISVGTKMSFSCKKGKFDLCFNRLDRPVEKSRPDRFPSLY